jgi:universal stress protein F
MFKKILLPIDVDYSAAAAAVYRKAAALAGLNGAEIRLISVMPGFGMPIVSSFISEDLRREAVDRFKALMEQFIQENCRAAVSYHIAVGKNWEEIIREADRWGADLIVVYHNREHDINEVFSRSCTQRVTDQANCSVLRLRNIMSP